MGRHKRRRGDKEVPKSATVRGWYLVEWYDTEKEENVIEQYRSAMDAQSRVRELGAIAIPARWRQK